MAKAGKLSVNVGDLELAKNRILACPSCAAGKAHQAEMPRRPSGYPRSTTKVLQLVHSDLMTDLPGARQYLMTIVDDYSGYFWAYALAKKSEALEAFNSWHAMMSTQFPIFSLGTI